FCRSSFSSLLACSLIFGFEIVERREKDLSFCVVAFGVAADATGVVVVGVSFGRNGKLLISGPAEVVLFALNSKRYLRGFRSVNLTQVGCVPVSPSRGVCASSLGTL